MHYNKFLQTAVLTIVFSACSCILLYNMEVEAVIVDKSGKTVEAKDVVKENKKKTGKVGFIDSRFISIIDSQGEVEGYEHETLMYLDKDATVTRKDSIDEIKVGDTIEVDYEKTTKTSKEAKKGKQVIKGVKFLESKGRGSILKGGKK